MRSIPATFAGFLVAASALPAPARAAESYDSCTFEITSLPAVLSSQGTWCLKADRSTALTSGAAITIAANNVTLDCNRHKLGGLSAGDGTQARGIEAIGRVNVAVRGCVVRGFYQGLYGFDVAQATVEDNVFEFNTHAGIWIEVGTDSIVRRNRVSSTGGATIATQASYGMFVEGDMDVVDNVIADVLPNAVLTNIPAYGIYTVSGRGAIAGNRIRAIDSSGSGEIAGIYNLGSLRLAIEGNVVDLDGQAGGIGIRCGNGNSVAAGNRLLGTPAGIINCASVDNHIDVD